MGIEGVCFGKRLYYDVVTFWTHRLESQVPLGTRVVTEAEMNASFQFLETILDINPHFEFVTPRCC
jgi:hypothetical protein